MHEGFFKCLATSSSNFFCSASMMDSPIILMSLSLIPIVIGTILFFGKAERAEDIFELFVGDDAVFFMQQRCRRLCI